MVYYITGVFVADESRNNITPYRSSPGVAAGAAPKGASSQRSAESPTLRPVRPNCEVRAQLAPGKPGRAAGRISFAVLALSRRQFYGPFVIRRRGISALFLSPIRRQTVNWTVNYAVAESTPNLMPYGLRVLTVGPFVRGEIAACFLRQRFENFDGIATRGLLSPSEQTPAAQPDDAHSVLRLNYETLKGLISLFHWPRRPLQNLPISIRSFHLKPTSERRIKVP